MENREMDGMDPTKQLDFPLYACSKEIIRRYKPFLDPLDLTYTQYLVLMALWVKGNLTVKALGEILYLDSGTLTPVLKKLEAKGYISRERDPQDERSVIISITARGAELKDAAADIPGRVCESIQVCSKDAAQLCTLLNRVLKCMTGEK